ncbi:hypothetical protein PAMP_015365 [Pampus punctatissimus]
MTTMFMILMMMMMISASALPLLPALNLSSRELDEKAPDLQNITGLVSAPYCFLSTCLTANLGSTLQTGDERAGSATTDPFGIGKK